VRARVRQVWADVPEYSTVGSRQEIPRRSTKRRTRSFIIGTRHHVLRDHGQCSPYSGWLRAGYVRFRGSITGRGKRFLSSAKCPDRVSDPLSLLFFSGGEGGKVFEVRKSPLTPSSTKSENKWYYRRTSTPAMCLDDMHRNDFGFDWLLFLICNRNRSIRAVTGYSEKKLRVL